jgi:polysaccharide pyruvyl transferase WcaK-like protein
VNGMLAAVPPTDSPALSPPPSRYPTNPADATMMISSGLPRLPPPPRTTRRGLLRSTTAGLACLSAACGGVRAAERPRRILLRSSWQTVNIGDVAHTPGLLALLERHLPDAEVRLWPSRVDGGVDAILAARFPGLRILAGKEDLAVAFEECDLLLHGSGPSLVAEKDVRRWLDATGKPFGVFGITLPRQHSSATRPEPEDAIRATVELLSRARFAFFRETQSLALAKELGCTAPVTGFAPDAAFATDLRDDAAAGRFLEAHGLEAGRFVCCIPRLRYTPYWTIPEKKAAFDAVKQARNEAFEEHDHAPHRRAIERIVRETGLQVLVCPEDRTQMAVGRRLLVDPLPPDVRRRVVWRADYWMPGEAISTYGRSCGLFGNEMHSPILCIGHGVPAIVCRWAEQTHKGLMWRDIGLGDWLFDFDDEADVARLPQAAVDLVKGADAARARAAAARERVASLHAEALAAVREAIA